jgi:exopolysaccharide biosynthesis polyprenyl glycosylphosphotransferase
MLFSDLCIVAASFFLGGLLKSEFIDFYQPNTYIIILPVLLLMWGVALYYFGIYESFRTRQIGDILLTLLEICMVVSSFFGGFIFLTKLESIDRIHVLYTLALATVSLCIEKVLLIYLFRNQRKKGFNIRNILIVGTSKNAQQYIQTFDMHDEWGIKIIGLVDEDATKINTMIHGHEVIGSFKDVPYIIKKYVVDEILFVIPHSWMSRFDEIEEIMYKCEIGGLRIIVAMDLFKPRLSKARFSYLDNFPILTFESTPNKLVHLFIKRLFDIFISALILFLLSPVFMIASVLIKLTSNGPVFFKQQRCSLYGRTFTIYKFRTMVKNAESVQQELLAYNEMKGPVFKMKNDPRVTKIGKFLRKFSIDELPQLLNVLKGDMSLVGPRPPIPAEVCKYEPWQRRRLSMRPGITCLWQVCGRNNITDFDEWMRLDLEYIDNWSLFLDYKILLKTIPTVLFGIGAK